MKRMLAVVLAVAAVPLQAAAADPTVTPIGAVQGRPLGEVLTRLGATRDPAPAISIQTAEGRTDIYPASELMPPSPAGQSCEVQLTGPEGQPLDRIAAVYAVVRDGRVVGWLNPPMAPRPARAPGQSELAWARTLYVENRDPWLSVAPGRLPLSDGDGFLTRRPDLAAPLEVRLTRSCRPLPDFASRPGAVGYDSAGFLQGLALLPFAWRLPSLNAERREARVAGPSLYAQLRLGEALPGGGEAFARTHRGVRRYVDREDPAYEVLVINMGAPPSNNLARMNAAALIGVRDGRVVWLADGTAAGGLGLTSALCVDSRSRAGRIRPGCTEYAFYSP